MSAKKAVERKDSATLRRARDLRGHESVIENARKSFIDMGRALGKIRADGLYEDGYDSFEAYLEERWDITPRHAYRLIEAARVALILRPIGPEINSEAVARELAPMTEDTDRMVEVYAEAERRAAGGRVTAALVREVRDQLYPGVIEGEFTNDDETPAAKSPLVNALRQAIEEVETSAGPGVPADQADSVGAGTPEHSATGVGDAAYVAEPEGDGDTSPVAVPTQTPGDQKDAPVEDTPAGQIPSSGLPPQVDQPGPQTSAVTVAPLTQPDADRGQGSGEELPSSPDTELWEGAQAIALVLDEVEGVADRMDALDVDVFGPQFLTAELDRLDSAVARIARSASLLRRWNSPESPRNTPGSPSPAVGVAAADGEVPDVPSVVPGTSGTEHNP